MSLLEIAKKRKSIRTFKDENINIDYIIYAIKLARKASTGANLQLCDF